MVYSRYTLERDYTRKILHYDTIYCGRIEDATLYSVLILPYPVSYSRYIVLEASTLIITQSMQVSEFEEL